MAGATYPWALNEAGGRLRAGERRAEYDEGVAVGAEGVVGVGGRVSTAGGGAVGFVARRERERGEGVVPEDEGKRNNVDRPERVVMRLWAGMEVVVGSAGRVDDFCVGGMAVVSGRCALALQGSMLYNHRSDETAPGLAAAAIRVGTSRRRRRRRRRRSI